MEAIIIILGAFGTFCYFVNRITNLVRHKEDAKDKQKLSSKVDPQILISFQDFKKDTEKRLQNLEAIIAKEDLQSLYKNDNMINTQMPNPSREKV